ncbi:WD40-repeat-containing domain protein [Geopyxis carbonaria]|nr:WD40-repeat-containing domain protein [Geopyxis carbonaria]
MAAPVQRLQATKLPTLPASTTPEQRYWRSFASPLLIHEYSSVTSIHFSPHAPHDFAVTSSSLIKVFSAKTRAVSKTISRFKDTAYAGQIRADGKVLAAADAGGTVQVFDMASRAVLRSWADVHKTPVQALRWNPRELTQLATAGDDATVRLWDLAVNAPVTTFSGHADYVRSLAYLPGSTFGGVVSGSYDKSARLWDPRAKAPALTFRHDAAIDAVLPMPGGTTLLVAAGAVVRVWDIVAARELAALSNHQKTVTALAHTSGATRRVLTGGLDGHVKIYDAASWAVVHGVKYPKPVLSVAVSPDERHLAVGMVDGLLSIRTRTAAGAKDAVREKNRALDLIARGIDPRAGAKKRSQAMARRLRGADSTGADADAVVDVAPRAKRERAFDKDLRKGRYGAALTRVLAAGDSGLVLTVLKELIYRNALATALAHRDEDGLRPVVEWCVRRVGDPRMVAVVAEVVGGVLDLYSHALGQSAEFDKLIRKLRGRVAAEVESARMASRAGGMLGLLMGGNE